MRKESGFQMNILCRPQKDSNKIPKGIYCHGATRDDVCPYWSINLSKPTQENGYCSFLERGDWEDSSGLSLLWDQVKECGINDEDDGDNTNNMS
jgi:hypothetical protein